MTDSSQPHQADGRSPDDSIYRLLANPRRRQVVWVLAIADGWEMTIQQLASHLTAYEEQTAISELARSNVTSVRNSLKRYHIGPLSALNILNVEWGTVSPGQRFFGAVRMILHAQEWSYERQIS